MDQLVQIAETFFEYRWTSRGHTLLRPRFDSLVVGASGTGKSNLVRTISRKLGVPVLRVSYAEWIVSAARERPHTLERIHAFVDENVRGIIHIDELDKFRNFHSTDWSVAVMVELFFLLDRSLRESKWTDVLQNRLATSILMVGTGTWQSVWSDFDKPTLGFNAEHQVNHPSIQQEIIKRSIIPAELLRRFRSQLIILPPPSEADYRQAAERFGLNDLAGKVGIELDYRSAKEQGLGARWLEEQLANLLCLARGKGITTAFEEPDFLFEDENPEGDPEIADPPL
jgi:SpoVK/Ycf46/Vps4 family AAA+-type ATPase